MIKLLLLLPDITHFVYNIIDNQTSLSCIPDNSACRTNCEVPCDKQLDCGTLCECWGTCSGNTYCSCQACDDMHADAAQDNQFFTIKDAAASSGAASADLIADTGSAGRRKLLQSSSTDNITAQLSEVLVKVDTLRTAQDSISGQMTALQGQVDKANLLAEARAANTKLQDLITGRLDTRSSSWYACNLAGGWSLVGLWLQCNGARWS